MLWEGVREPWQVWKLNAVLSHNPNPPQGIALPCCLAAQALMESSPERGKDSPEPTEPLSQGRHSEPGFQHFHSPGAHTASSAPAEKPFLGQLPKRKRGRELAHFSLWWPRSFSSPPFPHLPCLQPTSWVLGKGHSPPASGLGLVSLGGSAHLSVRPHDPTTCPMPLSWPRTSAPWKAGLVWR